MFKIAALLIVAFIATSSANQAVLRGLAEIDKHPFGSTLLSAIALNIKAKQTVADVGELLNEIEADLQADSATNLKYYTKVDTRLAKAIKIDNAAIAFFQTNINSLTTFIGNAQTLLAAKENSLTNAQGSLSLAQQNLVDLNAEYAVRQPKYVADIADLDEAVSAIANALSLLGQLQQTSPALLIQMTSTAQDSVKNAVNTLQSMKKKLSQHSNLYTPLIRELLDLSTNIDQSKVGRVVDLLQQLQNLLQDAANSLRAEYAQYVSSYNTQVAALESQITSLQRQITKLQQNIAALNTQIATAQGFLSANQQLLALAQAKLESDQAARAANQASFDQTKARLDNLIELIEKTIAYFERNFSELDEYTSGSIEGASRRTGAQAFDYQGVDVVVDLNDEVDDVDPTAQVASYADADAVGSALGYNDDE